MILKLILFCITMLVIPFIVGMLYIEKSRERLEDIVLCYLQGIVTIWGIFQIVAVPLIFMRERLTLLSGIMGGIVSALCLLSLILNFKRIPHLIMAPFRQIKSIPWQMWAAVLLVLLQTFLLVRYCHIDEDDAFFVASSATAVETDTIFSINPYTGAVYNVLPPRYVLSPFPAFIAVISKVSGIHSTIIAHTLLPAILIPLSYIVFGLVGSRILKRDKRMIGYFLILVSAIQLFSGYSVYTPGVFLLTRIWQGKAVLTNVLLPAVFCLGLVAYEKKQKRDWIVLLLLMFASCMVSSMGVFLGALTLGIFALINGIANKSFKIVFYSFLCCIPNLIYGVIYFFIK